MDTDADIHVGDVGTQLVVEIIDETEATVNVSAATSLQIFLKKPGTNGTVLTKTAVLDSSGGDGLIRYDSVSGDLDTAGTWKIQGRVTLAGKTWSSAEREFLVKNNLA